MGGTPPPPLETLRFWEVLGGAEESFGLNQLAPKAPAKIVDWPKARRKIWSNHFRGGGGPRGGEEVLPPPPPYPRDVELFSKTLVPNK